MRSKWVGKKRGGTTGGAKGTPLRLALERYVNSVGYPLVIGIDPDLHSNGLAIWDCEEATPAQVGTTRVSKDVSGQSCAAEVYKEILKLLVRADLPRETVPLFFVEGQRIRKDTPNPQSIVDLAACAGACGAAGLAHFPKATVIVVEPQAWKGSIPKLPHHRRIFKSLGWEFKEMAGYCAPIDPEVELLSKVNPGDWKHVGDGVGLAQWGVEQIRKTKSRLRRRKK